MPHEGETKTWLETEHGDQIPVQGICSIGRADSNNIILNYGVVSRHHAVIHERDGEYWIVDLGGVNGFLLNGDKVNQTARLQSGDVIQIPSADFIFYHEAVSDKAPAILGPKPTPPLESPLAIEVQPAPALPPEETGVNAIPKPALPQETPLEVTPKPAPSLPPAETSAAPAPIPTRPLVAAPETLPKPMPSLPAADASTPTSVTVTLPKLTKPTQQDELPLGLPSEPATQTGKLKKARVFVGPVDTQGMPKATPSQPTRPEAFKPVSIDLTKPSFPGSLPRQAEDSLKVTTPLSRPLQAEKPKEMLRIDAPDIMVPTTQKPKTPPALPAVAVNKADSFLEPTTSQVALSSTKSIAPPPRPKVDVSPFSEDDSLLLPPVAKQADPATKGAPAPLLAKPEPSKVPSPIHTAPPLLSSPEAKEQKPALKKGASPAKKEDVAGKPEIAPKTKPPLGDIPAPQTIPCASAKYSMYLGFASACLPFVGMITAIIAIVLGHSALSKIKASRGMLTGRKSAITGLTFAYICLGVISPYAIFYYFYFSSPSGTDNLVHSASAPAAITLTPPPDSPTNIPATTTITAPPPEPTPSQVPAAPANPTPTDMSATASPAPAVSTPDSQASIPSTTSTASPAPVFTPAPDMANATVPQTSTPAPAMSPPSTPASATPQTVISDGTGGNAAALLQSTSPAPDTNAAPSAPAAPVTSPAASTTGIGAVYSPDVQNRLKDGMLAQPMPQDTTSRAYMDAESFNNCARILARPPEAKYAESVGDFLDDAKKRNADPARIQILSTMFENYMAGIKRDF